MCFVCFIVDFVGKLGNCCICCGVQFVGQCFGFVQFEDGYVSWFVVGFVFVSGFVQCGGIGGYIEDVIDYLECEIDCVGISINLF